MYNYLSIALKSTIIVCMCVVVCVYVDMSSLYIFNVI